MGVVLNKTRDLGQVLKFDSGLEANIKSLFKYAMSTKCPLFLFIFFLGVGTAWSDGVASRGSSWLLLSNLTPQVRREYRK